MCVLIHRLMMTSTYLPINPQKTKHQNDNCKIQCIVYTLYVSITAREHLSLHAVNGHHSGLRIQIEGGAFGLSDIFDYRSAIADYLLRTETEMAGKFEGYILGQKKQCGARSYGTKQRNKNISLFSPWSNIRHSRSVVVLRFFGL